MKLSCALVLALTNLVIAIPFSFSVKGSGSTPTADPVSGTFGTFGLVQPVSSETGYSGTFSKSPSSSFASSSASEKSGSFSYNAAQGTPSVAYNTAGFGASGQFIGQNAAVSPQAVPSAVPLIHNTGSSVGTEAIDYSSSKNVNDISAHAGTPSKIQSEYKPNNYLVPNSQGFVSQDISKPNVFVSGSTAGTGVSSSLSSEENNNFASNLPAGQRPGNYLGSASQSGYDQSNTFVPGSPAYSAGSDSFLSKDMYSVQVNTDTTSQFQHQVVATDQKPGYYFTKPNVFVSHVASKEPEKLQGSLPVQGFPSPVVSGSVVSVPTSQALATPTVEQKPVYGNGFGGPPGVLSPYDKEYTSGAHIPASNSRPYQQNAQISESVNFKPPSYAFQQQQTVRPVQSFSTGANYFASNAESSYKPEINPTYQNENKQVLVNNNERPSSDFKPLKDVQSPFDKYSYQKPDVESQQKPEVSVEYPSQTNKPGYQISNQAYPASSEKVEPTKKPLYTGGFGAPAGVLVPNQSTFSEVQNFASTTVKPEQYEESKATAGSTQTFANVNKYSSISGEVKPKEKTYFGNSHYQSFGVSSTPASYVTYKPTGSESYSEQDRTTSSFGVSSSAERLVASQQKDREQILSEPHDRITVNPTFSTWEQNPTQASNSFVQKPDIVEPVKPAVPISSQSKPTFSNAFGTYTTSKPLSDSYPIEEKNPTSPFPGGYGPNGVSVTLDGTKLNYQGISSNQYESSQSGAVAYHAQEKQPSYQPYPTGSSYANSNVASYKPVESSVLFDKSKTSQKGVVTDSKVKVPSNLPEQVNKQQITSTSFGTVKPTVTQDSAVQSNTATGFVSVSQQYSKKPSFESSSDKIPAFAISGNPLSLSSYKPSTAYVEQKEPQKPTSEVINKETPSKVSVFTSNEFSDKIEAQFPKKPITTDQNKPLYSSSFGTLTGSTGYTSSSYGQETSFVTGSNGNVPQTTFGTTVKPDLPTASQQATILNQNQLVLNGKLESNADFTNPSKQPFSNKPNQAYNSGVTTDSGNPQQSPSDGLSSVSIGSTSPQQSTYQTLTDTSKVTSSVSQNTDNQKHTNSTYVQNKPKVTPQEQKVTNQAFISNTAFASGATPFGSKPQYQYPTQPTHPLPTTQSAVQKNSWNSNSFGTFVTAKPYNAYPGFTSSFTTYGQDSSVSSLFDKTKQTTQITSTGQYTPFTTGQYKPYTSGQYKPHNWGFNRQSSYQKFPNVYPTGGTFVSTYALTTFKPFATSSPFEKSKTDSVTGKKESSYVSGFGSPLSVTTAKPSWLSQTSFKPVSELSVSGGTEKSKITDIVSTPPKYEISKSKQSETQSQISSHLTQNSGLSVTSNFGQSSFSTVKPTVNLPTPSAQFEFNSEKVKPSTQSTSEVVGFNTNNEVTKVSESSYTSTPVAEVNPASENKPYSNVYAGSSVTKPFTPTSQIIVNEKIQSSQTAKPNWSSNVNQKEFSVDVGVKPTGQPFLGTSSYSIHKEVTPTQVSATKPSSYGYFTVDTASQSKGDGKIQYNQTPKPEWSTVSNQKESSLVVSGGGVSESLKPTGQSFLGTSSYSFNKEVTPTQVSAIKPSNFGTFSIDTSSQNKANENLQFSQTTKPVSSSFSNQGVASERLNQNVQPLHGTNHGIFSTSQTTGSANVGSTQPTLSNVYEGDSAVHLSSVENWSSTPTPAVTYKPEYSTSFVQSSGYVSNSFPSVNQETNSATVFGSKDNSKPLSSTGHSQYVSYDTNGKPVFPKPTAHVSVVENKPGFVVNYKEKDINQPSVISTFAKPTVPSEHSTDGKVTSNYSDGPAKVPTVFYQSAQIPYKPTVTNTETNQQALGFNSNTGTSQSTQTSYVGGFGGPPGILKPNDFSSQSQQQYVQTQYKPSYNNVASGATQQKPPSGSNPNAASYFGGFGAPSGVLTANENVKPNSFGYVQSVNKYTENVQAQNNANQQAVFESQVSAGQSNAAVNPSTVGLGSTQQQIQNPFNGGVSTGTGFNNNDYILTGQSSRTNAFGTAQNSAGTSAGFHSYGKRVLPSLL